MNDESYITREELRLESEFAFKSIQLSRIKVLVEMLMATVVIMFWWPNVGVFDGTRFRNVLYILPPILNALSWLYWIMLAYASLAHSFTLHGYASNFNLNERPREALQRYDQIQYSLRHYKRIEHIYDVLIGIQFFLVGILSSIAIFG